MANMNFAALSAFEARIASVKGKKGKTSINLKLSDDNKRSLTSDRADFSDSVDETARTFATNGGGKYTAKMGLGEADKNVTKEVGADDAALAVYILTGSADSEESARRMAVMAGALKDVNAEKEAQEAAAQGRINRQTDDLLMMVRTRPDLTEDVDTAFLALAARDVAESIESGNVDVTNAWDVFSAKIRIEQTTVRAARKMAEEMSAERNVPIADTNGAAAPVKPNGRGKKAGAAAD